MDGTLPRSFVERSEAISRGGNIRCYRFRSLRTDLINPTRLGLRKITYSQEWLNCAISTRKLKFFACHVLNSGFLSRSEDWNGERRALPFGREADLAGETLTVPHPRFGVRDVCLPLQWVSH